MTDAPRDQEPEETGTPGEEPDRSDKPEERPNPAGPEARRRRMTFAPVATADPSTPEGQRQRRRRQFFIAGIAAAAVIVVGALCAGTLGIAAAVRGARERAADSREARHLRDAACLELERRLNRLAPPGAATSSPQRAIAIQAENVAVRIYVAATPDEHDQDAWRQLLDSRTAYAQALTDQAKTHTPAFYVTPRGGDGDSVTDLLVDRSPGVCAGPIRRLATPDL